MSTTGGSVKKTEVYSILELWALYGLSEDKPPVTLHVEEHSRYLNVLEGDPGGANRPMIFTTGGMKAEEKVYA